MQSLISKMHILRMQREINLRLIWIAFVLPVA